MIADLHCDTITKVLAGEAFDTESEYMEVSLPALRKGGVTLQVFAAFVSSAQPEQKSFREAERLLNGTDQLIAEYPGMLIPVSDPEDLETIERNGLIAIIKAVENGQAIENSLDKLASFRKSGVRYMTLTHSRNLKWAASSAEERCDFDGLTRFGEQVILAMNDLGVIVDVSHVHETTFWKVAKLSKKPFIASHSNAFRLCPTARNLKDDQIKAIADSGGMIGINFFPGFLDALYEKEMTTHTVDLFHELQKMEQEYLNDPVGLNSKMKTWSENFRRKMELHTVGPDRIIDHVEYIIDLVGADFVGFGSDFDGVPALPEGMKSCADMRLLIERMRERHFSEQDIEKISWQNFKRVLQLNS